MILDKLINAERYYNLHPGLGEAFRFLQRKDLADLADAVYEIDGKRVYATIFDGEGKGRKSVKLEAHRKYIDIHYAIAGFDEIGWNPIQECTSKEGEYDEKKDYQLYANVPKIWVPHAPGTFIIFFPEDAHAPITVAKNLHKIVVKIAVKW